MLSVCIDVRPARLVERWAVPSGPILFELREREMESERIERQRDGSV